MIFFWIYEKYLNAPLPDWQTMYLYYNAQHDMFCLGTIKVDIANTVVGQYNLIGEF